MEKETKIEKIKVSIVKNRKYPCEEIPRIELTFKVLTENVFPNIFKVNYYFDKKEIQKTCERLNNLYKYVLSENMDIDEINNIHKIHYQLTKLVDNEFNVAKDKSGYKITVKKGRKKTYVEI